MANFLKSWARRLIAAPMVVAAFAISGAANAVAQDSQQRTIGNLSVYIGVVPAEIVKGPGPHSGERPMHGRIPKGQHRYHVIAALFDVATGARISDARVSAQVSGLGLAGTRKPLEAMQIAGTTTYGNFFRLPGRDLYTIRLMVERPGMAPLVSVDFKYDHRTK